MFPAPDPVALASAAEASAQASQSSQSSPSPQHRLWGGLKTVLSRMSPETLAALSANAHDLGDREEDEPIQTDTQRLCQTLLVGEMIEMVVAAKKIAAVEIVDAREYAELLALRDRRATEGQGNG